ncbi:MAG: hypothetical protein HPY76_08650 [Anaerolineae bacterium]|nr:hypothetical protein [Anaerolineae bacterium]
MAGLTSTLANIWGNKKYRSLLLLSLILLGVMVDILLDIESVQFGRYEIHGKRLLLFSIGLLTALISMVTLFKSWKFFIEEALPFGAILAPFAFWVTSRTVELDFWYDELVTLTRFVFVPLQTTLTDYPYPNNHIFFNLLNNLYLKAAGLSQLTTLMEHPSFIRYLMLFYAIIGLVYLYLTGREFAGKLAGQFSLLVLATSIPFFNFATQVRGYGLSITLVCAMLFHWWRYEQKLAWRHLAAFTTAGALLIYTMPSTLYILAGMMGWSGLVGLRQLFARRAQPLRPDTLLRTFAIPIAGLVAIGAAVLCYSPVLSSVLNNSVVSSRGMFKWVILTRLLPRVLTHFVSARWLLVALALAGLALLFTRAIRQAQPGTAQRVGGLLFLLLAPFVMSYVRGDNPFDRIFLVQLPVFSLLIGIGLQLLCRRLPQRLQRPGWVLFLLGVYTAVVFSTQILRNEALVRQNNAAGIGSQTIYANFYLVDYRPDQLMRDFFSQQDELAHEFYIYDLGDNASAREYSAKYYGYYPSTVESLAGFHGAFYVFTAFPNQFLAEVQADYPHTTCQRLNSAVWYQNIFLCDAGTP